jgi:uncharacterized protein YndB with AHSA1/START domain
MTTQSTDKIEKRVLLRAPKERIWRALTNAVEFGAWFGVNLTGEFRPGARVRGQITHEGYEHVPFEVTVERMEPERLFSFRWHPNAIEQGADYSAEPTTLVAFELQEVSDGIMLTVTESGFDRIPLARRAEAFRGNEEGWAFQMKSIEEYVGRSA